MNNEIARILFQDESMIRDYQAISNTWFLKGKQRIVPTYGRQQGVKILGTLNYGTGEVFCTESSKYDAKSFLKFLKKIVAKYSEGKTIMILDNAKIHHAKLIQDFLEENKDKIELVFLPPYSPDLNLIEGLWKWLKERVVNNVFYENVSEIRDSVKAFIDDINSNKMEVVDRLCLKL